MSSIYDAVYSNNNNIDRRHAYPDSNISKLEAPGARITFLLNS